MIYTIAVISICIAAYIVVGLLLTLGSFLYDICVYGYHSWHTDDLWALAACASMMAFLWPFIVYGVIARLLGQGAQHWDLHHKKKIKRGESPQKNEEHDSRLDPD